uniref:Activin types I and II receptor domain-containing protein n=1 Tax=Acrobeloides nanus TaxID=290746 RepID=A0A914CRC5_9BILA
MNSLYTLSVLFLYLYAAYGLQCYDGFAILKGSTTGNDTITCGKSTDMCYKANMDLKSLMHVKLAGCSTIKCMLHGNGCTNRTIAGITIDVCCCNTDFCNDFGEQQRPSSEQLKQILSFFSEETSEKDESTDQKDKINKLEKIIDSKPLESSKGELVVIIGAVSLDSCVLGTVIMALIVCILV